MTYRMESSSYEASDRDWRWNKMQPSKEEIMETIIFDLNYLGESSQEQLDAYRKLGSVRSLKRLSDKERQRRKLKKNLKKAFTGILCTAFLAFDLWLIASWFDIVTHNTCPDPVYQAWNFFVLFF